MLKTILIKYTYENMYGHLNKCKNRNTEKKNTVVNKLSVKKESIYL